MGSFYKKIYLQSWQIIKYNWHLLIFGIFVSLMGFKEIKILFNLNALGGDFLTYNTLYWLDTFKSLFTTELSLENLPTTLSVLGIFVIFAVLLVLIISSQGALIKATADNEKKIKKGKFNKYLQIGIENFWELFGLMILNSLILIILISGIIIPLIYLVAENSYSGGLNFLLSIITFFILVPLIVIVSLVTRYGASYIVLKKDSLLTAFLNGWRLFKTNWIISIENAFFLLLVTILYILSVSTLITIIVVPFLILASLLGAINYFGFWFVFMAGSFSVIIILLLTTAIWGAYYSIIWTNVFLELTSRVKKHSKVQRLLHKK